MAHYRELPRGVYCVFEAFEQAEGAVEFIFRDQTYRAVKGENAFACVEDLIAAPMECPAKPFFGYKDTPVILFPAGQYRAYAHANTKETRLRTYFPCAVTVLGENVGISPNGEDLRGENPQRRPESVIVGNFYFGCFAIRGELPGTMTVDGIELQAKVYDERTGGDNAALVVKNCQLKSSLCYDIFKISGPSAFSLTDCRCDGMDALCAEGRLIGPAAANVTVERLYMANTDKFPGLSNYSFSAKNALPGGVGKVLLKDCIFENCTAARGLTVQLPEEAKLELLLENCEFTDCFPEAPAVELRGINEDCHVEMRSCRFAGAGSTAVQYSGSDNVEMTDCICNGYDRLCREKTERRTAVDPNAVYPLEDPHAQTQGDLSVLDELYAGKQCFYGDFHCHSDSGGTSDGKTPLREYLPRMKELGVDFAAIVDHRQMRHFFLPEWDETYMIPGTEPGTTLQGVDRPQVACRFDYTMIFPDKTGLQKVFDAFPEFQFTGGWDGYTGYPNFTKERFLELADFVWSIGGLLSHAHPKQLMASRNPMDYYFGDRVPLETVHVDVSGFATRQNRELWETLLKMGKRIRTHGSSDAHGPVSNRGLTAVYAPRHFSKDIFEAVRSGNCTAGGVAIRMSIDDCPMGSATAYAPGKKLYLRLDGFHFAHKKENTVYCLKVFTDKGLAYAREFDGSPQSFVLPVEKRLYYRVEITNESDGQLVALSNPIWLDWEETI